MLSIATSGANASRRYNLLAAARQAREPLVPSRQARCPSTGLSAGGRPQPKLRVCIPSCPRSS